MNKVKINMIGGCFYHDVCSSAGSIPELIEWDKTGNSNISIHLDYSIKSPVNKSKLNFAWIFEASTINTDLVNWVRNNISYLEDNFEYIFTHDKTLLLSDKFKFVKCCPKPWIKNVGIHQKTKLTSMISSNKSLCDAHRYRLKILNKYLDFVDCYGRGHNFIEKKEFGLNDYCFSIAIENGDYPDMFSEKITDCFATGTIPIYWGTSNIGQYFNENGIIIFNDNFKINDLSIDLYKSKMESIEDNFERVMKLPTAEDHAYELYIKNY